MSNIDLSIIIPVYNVENYLRRGLDSILSQSSLIKYEILLIDDDSSDNSGAICDEYQNNYSNVFVTHIENNGVAEARNLGISLSRGNYLYFMDPDDFYLMISLKGYLLKLIKNGMFFVLATMRLKKIIMIFYLVVLILIVKLDF
ncbi:MAG: glycosyltransferase family 2 protein [Streptococcus salivarius]